MEEFIEIGYTKKQHGLKGHIKIHIEDNYIEDFSQSRFLFVDTPKAAKLPLFIEEVKLGKDLIVKFEKVNSIEEASVLRGKGLFLRPEDLIPDADRQLEVDDLEFGYLEGYSFSDQQSGQKGIITQIEAYPQQDMAHLELENGKTCMVPVHEDFIIDITEEEKQIIFNLPEGILNL